MARVSILRIVVLAGALGLGGAAVLYAQAELAPHTRDFTEGQLLPQPWITLPESASLLHDPGARKALFELYFIERTMQPAELQPHFGLEDSLIFQCDEHRATSGVDIYQVWAADPWGPHWQAEIRVRGNVAEVSRLEQLTISAPLPPGDPSSTAPQPLISVARKHELGTFPLSALEEVRVSWIAPELWHHTKTGSLDMCTDGGPLILAACVRGELGVRLHHCDRNTNAAQSALREAIERNLALSIPRNWDHY